MNREARVYEIETQKNLLPRSCTSKMCTSWTVLVDNNLYNIISGILSSLTVSSSKISKHDNYRKILPVEQQYHHR